MHFGHRVIEWCRCHSSQIERIYAAVNFAEFMRGISF